MSPFVLDHAPPTDSLKKNSALSKSLQKKNNGAASTVVEGRKQVMGNQLSYTIRDKLLTAINDVGDGNEGTTKELLERTRVWVDELDHKFGFEQLLVKNLAILANHLRLNEAKKDIRSLASGAIQLITAESHIPGFRKFNPSAADQTFLNLCKAFIASYTTHEISVRLGEPTSFQPPSITSEERVLAEDLFGDLIQENVEQTDEDLTYEVDKKLQEVKLFNEFGFLDRLALNAKFLLSVLENQEHTAEDKQWARGALRYLIKTNDIVDDSLGIIGYLDDVAILQTAVDLVHSTREPLLELIDETVRKWPFLNRLVLDTGAGPKTISEYLILNAALSCQELRGNNNRGTLLVMPETGLTPAVIGFISALGEVHGTTRKTINESCFRRGQKVLVDYEAVAIFEGFETLSDGRRMFKLRQNRTEGPNKNLGSVRYWPIIDLERLVPAGTDRTVRGNLDRQDRSTNTFIGAISFLFNDPVRIAFHTIEKKTLVVMPISKAKDFCQSTSVYGQPLKDVIPVGQINADGDAVVHWSTKLGVHKPVLLFAADLDTATSYIEQNLEEIGHVVIDASGKNSEKHASMKRLNRLQCPYLIVAPERIINETNLDSHENLNIWEWTKKDFRSLVWEQKISSAGKTKCELTKLSNNNRHSFNSEINAEAIPFQAADDAYAALDTLKQLVAGRGDDGLAELDQILAESYYSTTALMRCSTPLEADTALSLSIDEHLAKIKSLTTSSTFLSSEETAAALHLVDCTKIFKQLLLDSNPKYLKLCETAAKFPTASIICMDSRILPDLKRHFGSEGHEVLPSLSAGSTYENGIIIPAWFNQARMGKLIVPPVSDPLILLLYSVEQKWHQQFCNNRIRKKRKRAAASSRKNIFPVLDGWKKQESPQHIELIEPSQTPIDHVSKEINTSFKRRILEEINVNTADTDTEARLLLFDGGAYGLFTDNYKLNVVTHLIDHNESSATEDHESTVKLAYAKDVSRGDRIVFRPKCSDLIREVADENLELGVRELSSLWQVALKQHKEDAYLSDEDLRAKLKDKGCKIHIATLKNWLSDDDMIAPLKYRKDIPRIAELTGHPELTKKLDEVIQAVSVVLNAHRVVAPKSIAQQVRQNAAVALKEELDEEPVVALGDNLLLVRVAETASEKIPVKYSNANRLVEPIL